MEALFVIFLIYGGFWLVGQVLSSGASAVKTAVTGKETYFGPTQIKFVDEIVDDTDVVFKKIMLRGNLCADRSMRLAFSVSAFDATDGDDDLSFVISLLDKFQEEDTICFGLTNEIGLVSQGDCFTDWVQLGAISPDFIQGPKSGNVFQSFI